MKLKVLVSKIERFSFQKIDGNKAGFLQDAEN